MTDIFQSELYQVLWETRRLFQRLSMVASDIHQDSEITASMRAILEFLSQYEPQTVPQMAREKSVSRQHIQVIVNELLAHNFVELIANPAHRRSPLVQMTQMGKQRFNEIKERETFLFTQMEPRFSPADLKTTLNTLRELNRYFQSEDWQAIVKHDNQSSGDKL